MDEHVSADDFDEYMVEGTDYIEDDYDDEPQHGDWCPKCGGTGIEWDGPEACPYCLGEGYVWW